MSWESALSILREARDTPRQRRVACPNDGEPLTTGPDGQPFCRFDGWRPTTDEDLWER